MTQPARQRTKQVLYGAAGGAIAKAIQFGVSVALIPIGFRHLGTEAYGIWMTITAAVSLLTFADLGIGNSLVNAVATAMGTNDKATAQKSVSTAVVLLTGVATVMLVLLGILYPLVPWGRLFNARSAETIVATNASMAIAVAFFALAMPLGVVQRAQLGMQRADRVALTQAAGALMSLGGVTAAVKSGFGLPGLVAGFLFGPLGALCVAWFLEFSFPLRLLRPRLSLYSGHIAGGLLRKGLAFALAQGGSLLMVAGPSLVTSQVLGPDAVAAFSVAFRPITALTVTTALWTAPLWPAYADAKARGDYRWIRTTVTRTSLIAIGVSTLAACAYLVTYRPIVTLLASATIVPSATSVLLLGIYAIANSGRWTASMCLNGCDRLAGQMYYQALGAAAAIGIGALLGAKFGLQGIFLGLALGEVAVTSALFIEVRSILTRLDSADSATFGRRR